MSDSSSRVKIDLEHKIEILELKLKLLSLQLKDRIECPYCGHKPVNRCDCCNGLISFCPMCGKKIRTRTSKVVGASGSYKVGGGTGGGQPGG